MKLKRATLEIIAMANGKKTGDELIAEQMAKERAEKEALQRSGNWVSAKDRRRFRAMERKIAERMEANK